MMEELLNAFASAFSGAWAGLLGGASLDPGLAIAAAGVAVTAAQLWLGRRRQRLDTTLQLIERMQSEEARRARFKARAVMERAASMGGRFDQLESEERSLLSSIASHFGLAELLIRRRKLDADLFIDMFGNSAMVNYQRLEPYRQWRRQRYGAETGSAWAQFEGLARRAERRLGPRDAPARPVPH